MLIEFELIEHKTTINITPLWPSYVRSTMEELCMKYIKIVKKCNNKNVHHRQ